MPVIDLSDEELAALTAAIRDLIEQDRFPHAPRLDPLRAALTALEQAEALRKPPAAKETSSQARNSKTHKARWRPS
jgi:hypothetical protein